MRHPSGVGLWAVAIRGVGWPVFVPGHTAHQAWQAAGSQLGYPGFDECTFLLLSDRFEQPRAARRRALEARP